MMQSNVRNGVPTTWIAAAALMMSVLAGCGREEPAASAGPAEQVGAKVDQAAAVASDKLESFKEKHGPKIDEVKEATADGVRKLTGVVGEQLERAGQKAQELSKKNDTP